MTVRPQLGILSMYAVGIVVAALFPRLAYWVRWPTRLGVRGRIAYAGYNALMMFAIRQFVVPRLSRWVKEQERVNAELRRQLGREPTEREWFEHLGIEHP
jgi:hypothetical protein